MTKIQSFKDLIVWQRAMELVKEIYLLTDEFPDKERFGLTSQMRRSAVSIPSNIAEGNKRGTRKDFANFLKIASGSAAELETQLLISEKIYKKISTKRSKELLTEVQKMLSIFIKKLSD